MKDGTPSDFVEDFDMVAVKKIINQGLDRESEMVELARFLESATRRGDGNATASVRAGLRLLALLILDESEIEEPDEL